MQQRFLSKNNSGWICCQLGAREHYAIPRVLHENGQLKTLITDVWLDSNHVFNWLPKTYLSNIRERYHPQLSTAKVKSFTSGQIAWEIIQRRKYTDWELIIRRNLWWQDRVIEILEQEQQQNIILFAYSYAALKSFKCAKNRG